MTTLIAAALLVTFLQVGEVLTKKDEDYRKIAKEFLQKVDKSEKEYLDLDPRLDNPEGRDEAQR